MHVDNVSLASLARSTHGGVGVGDLREALGRGSASNLALATASMNSTLDRKSSIGTGRRSLLDKNKIGTGGVLGAGTSARAEPLAISRIKSKRGKAPPSEVRDVLNKLGIGKQSGGNNLLKTPFPPQSQKDKDPTAPAETNGKPGKPQDSMVEPPY